MLLNACRTLAADYTFVDGMITIAINVSDFAIFQMNLYAAATGAHVTCGGFNLVPIFGRRVDLRLGEDSHVATIAKHRDAHYGPYSSSVLGQLLANLASGTMMEPIIKIGPK
jgi:hypothetical protein